ncbi:hypothetical protein F4779DRAFT_642149 [Xylariaceae sp. FL0662B]|nr:hypothetical protein F4779DRAFT_642149 [Xylariaceae sp. FL0662B]
MPKNKGQGGKTRRRGKKDDVKQNKQEFIFKEECQAYARIEKVLGSGRFNVRTLNKSNDSADGQTVHLAILRGNMRKKVNITPNDIVLLSLREFQEAKADIIHKYTLAEVRKLQEYDELPMDALVGQTTDTTSEDFIDVFEFAEADNDEDHDDEDKVDIDNI